MSKKYNLKAPLALKVKIIFVNPYVNMVKVYSNLTICCTKIYQLQILKI